MKFSFRGGKVITSAYNPSTKRVEVTGVFDSYEEAATANGFEVDKESDSTLVSGNASTDDDYDFTDLLS